MTLAERMTRLETKMEAVEQTITEVRDLLKNKFQLLTDSDGTLSARTEKLEKRIRELEENAIQLKGKKGWLIAGAILVLILLLGLNILDEGDILQIKTWLE